MLACNKPEDLNAVAIKLRSNGVRGVLISGGCDLLGRVPFEDYIESIRYLKELGFKVYIHSGIVDDNRARLLKESGVDAVLIDFVIHEGAIKEVLGLDDVNAYLRSLKILMRHSLNVIPHVVIGLYKGLPSNEFKAIDILSKLKPKAVVFVVFTPYPGTPYEDLKPPNADYVIKVLKYGRLKLSGIPLTLGCMRPRYEEYLDVELKAIEYGFNGLAFPSGQTINYLVVNGLKFRVVNECCASIFNYVGT